MFTLFVILWLVGLRKQHAYPRIKHTNLLWVLSSGVTLALGTEAVQHFFGKGRSFDWYDIVANLVGCCFGVFLFRIIYGYWPK